MKIQKVWKKYYNSRIYFFYRDLIKIREKGDPFEMLKYINPREARIIDRSQVLHIRFRLGGVRSSSIIEIIGELPSSHIIQNLYSQKSD